MGGGEVFSLGLSLLDKLLKKIDDMPSDAALDALRNRVLRLRELLNDDLHISPSSAIVQHTVDTLMALDNAIDEYSGRSSFTKFVRSSKYKSKFSGLDSKLDKCIIDLN